MKKIPEKIESSANIFFGRESGCFHGRTSFLLRRSRISIEAWLQLHMFPHSDRKSDCKRVRAKHAFPHLYKYTYPTCRKQTNGVPYPTCRKQTNGVLYILYVFSIWRSKWSRDQSIHYIKICNQCVLMTKSAGVWPILPSHQNFSISLALLNNMKLELETNISNTVLSSRFLKVDRFAPIYKWTGSTFRTSTVWQSTITVLTGCKTLRLDYITMGYSWMMKWLWHPMKSLEQNKKSLQNRVKSF